jgi:carbamoyltransferase
MLGKSDVVVIGVSVSAVASACLLRNGHVVASVSEERLNRIKSWSGFPSLAIREVLDLAGLGPDDVHRLVFHGYSPWVYGLYDGDETGGHTRAHLSVRHSASELLYAHPRLWPTYRIVRDDIYRPLVHGRWQRERLRVASSETGVPLSRITCADHHTCHAYAGLHGVLGRPTGDFLVLTSDGRGDDCCARVSTYRDGTWRRIASTPNDHSIGHMYLAITEYLGMKPNEHEYKVMGLAPYAAQGDIAEALAALKRLIWRSGLEFRSLLPSQSFYYYFREHLERQRFDWVAGAVQTYMETLMQEWTAEAVRQTGLCHVVLSGGNYLNVKANMLIGALPEVEALSICPSPSDDSSAIGAAYWGYEQECLKRGLVFDPQPLDNLYLGRAYSNDEIERSIARFRAGGGECRVERTEDMAGRIADLLVQGEVVARFDGREEFGARALGNRSLLAHPRDMRTVTVLNKQIKSRDFWMPFAGTVLSERQYDYLRNPKEFAAPHMVLTFETTESARKEMLAAMHPADFTMRPQVLDRKMNSGYHEVLKRFEARTGIGGVLNTSFNLHGEPIVSSPDDALATFARSGLRYVALGEFLVSKPDRARSDSGEERRDTIANGVS